MVECSQRLVDPFLVSGEGFIDHMVLRNAIESHPKDFRKQKFARADSNGPWLGGADRRPIGGTRNEKLREEKLRNFVKRLALAAGGGIFLLGPMWLMVLHRTIYTALISTTCCVITFGFLMSYYLDKDIDVVSSSAGYAAVLVVFVGLNTTPLS